MRYLFLILLINSISFSDRIKRDNLLKVVIDPINKLIWMDDYSVVKVMKKHEEAIKYCKNLDFAGHSNWRLPEIKEFKLIVDKRKKTSINKVFKFNLAKGYWAKKAHWRTLWFYADYMLFLSGTPYFDNRNKLKYVRCVRTSK